ncbi:hypothetical protein HN014_16665 [Aquimarina sp. TRL1]|uniref:hypothetical protein n=1 Tax=Aquimarina sp. (strain TRL1) TaxID=2736252 RepID=UPI00158E6A24|nr:hypothetical protein [Aquimarina sp. TRL1]QKX06477.1 hypothetical protein HN014_16665 [Aquimarina sp. TRL1]
MKQFLLIPPKFPKITHTNFTVIKTVFFLTAFCMHHTSYTQEKLLHIENIEANEHKVIKAFGKLKKRPKKKRLQEKFSIVFNNAISKHKDRLHTLSHPSPIEDKNWEGLTNALRSIQFLNELATSSGITPLTKTPSIDSITALATTDLYTKGKASLNKTENSYAYEIAYTYLTRALQFTPNYKDLKKLIDITIAEGTRNVYFTPVTYQNLGNYVEWGNDNSSVSSDFIIEHLSKDISVNNVGSHFVQNKLKADRVIAIEWVSINISPEKNHQYTIKRSSQIMENGKEKTVSATVHYHKKHKDITGTLNIKIKDTKAAPYLINENLSGTRTFEKTEVTYTGDKRALTQEDKSFINNSYGTNNLNFNYTNNYNLITEMYLDTIHNQVLNHIGKLLNWNYNM